MGAEVSSLRQAWSERVLIADGAMGTMLQASDATLGDFQAHEGCNEILNITRPDIVRAIHDAYFAVGVDAVETNTFGANFANLAEYGIPERIGELAEAGARIARESATQWSTPGKPRYVLGSVGPGTKLPTLGHTTFATLRDAYREQTLGLISGGADAIMVETAQDLLQAKAALIGARRALAEAGVDLPLIASVTIELNGTMLLGTEITAALAALEPLGIDMIGLNCATGPAEMSEHLRQLAHRANVRIGCLPNAGLPQLTPDGASYPLSPSELADAHERFVRDYGLSLVGGCCGTTPEHLRAVVERLGVRAVTDRVVQSEPGLASLYQAVPFRQDVTFLSIGERTNANGSKAFRDALIAENWDGCLDIAREQIRDGAHVLDLCVDYVGRNGVQDMQELAGRLATASTLPIMLDSTEPPVILAGLEKLGGRAVVNSVNYEDGDGPNSRMSRLMPLVMEHGAAVVALTIDETGQARTADWKVQVAERLINDLTGRWGMSVSDILVDALTFPIATGQEETRRDGLETIDAIRAIKARWPEVQTTLGVSNVSFGLNPAARIVLNSVFLHEARQAGLDSAIAHASKILPLARIPGEQVAVALDLIYDRRRYRADDSVEYDPLSKFLELFEGATAANDKATRAQELAALPLNERLERRIVDGERVGLEADLDEALAIRPAMAIINETLLSGMRTVGELFGSGQMQLPFVLQSAEVMKAAVAYLEPHLEHTESSGGKGSILLATVKGDVHDIGKNLVDIILTNNGYRVVNLGIKVPITEIITHAEAESVDVIGMSGLLVKSTMVMKDNLEELTVREMANRWPIILGGAALTRAYVEEDLAGQFSGTVRYAKDAFEGLHLMEKLIDIRNGVPGAELPPLRKRRVKAAAATVVAENLPARSAVATDVPIPTPPFWGERIVKGIPLAEYAAFIDERALFLGQWGLKSTRTDGPSYEELVETEGRPRLRMWLDRLLSEGMLETAVVYGYLPAVSDGNEIVVLKEPGDATSEIGRWKFPRQLRDRRLCLADYLRPIESGQTDVLGAHIVTMGNRISEAANKLFEANAYREYVELHGLSVQLTEALAEFWHARVRRELGIAGSDAQATAWLLKQQYQGERYSFGYPACPDLENQTLLCELLRPDRIGVELSSEFQLHPEQSTSALIFHHPEASYFNAT